MEIHSHDTQPAFSSSIINSELYIMALSSNLLIYERYNPGTLRFLEMHKEIVEYDYTIFRDRVVYTCYDRSA